MMEPGNVASVLENTSILDGLLNVTDSLANVVQSFIPIIEDSQTSSVPCGGAVRAEGFTDNQCVRGWLVATLATITEEELKDMRQKQTAKNAPLSVFVLYTAVNLPEALPD